MIGSLNYFVLTFFVTFMNVAYFSIDGMYINRAFHNFPISLIEDSVVLLDSSGSFAPYYDKYKVKNNVVNYLKLALENKVSSFDISFNYYVYDADEVKIDTSYFPKNVDIHLKCTYFGFMQYEGYRNFEIRGEKVYE